MALAVLSVLVLLAAIVVIPFCLLLSVGQVHKVIAL